MLETRRQLKVTESIARVSKMRLRVLSEEYTEQPGVEYQRPRTRAECQPGGPLHIRPCPFVSCKHHLAVSVKDNGNIEYVFGTDDIASLKRPTCALDVVDDNPGGMTLDNVAKALGLTRERVRQVEGKGIRKLKEIVKHEDHGY